MANSTQITTGKVRFSYCNLFTPRAVDNGPAKYSVTLLIPKSDKATLSKIKAAIEAAKTAYIQRNSGKKLPSNLKNTLHDGDGERHDTDRRANNQRRHKRYSVRHDHYYTRSRVCGGRPRRRD